MTLRRSPPRRPASSQHHRPPISLPRSPVLSQVAGLLQTHPRSPRCNLRASHQCNPQHSPTAPPPPSHLLNPRALAAYQHHAHHPYPPVSLLLSPLINHLESRLANLRGALQPLLVYRTNPQKVLPPSHPLTPQSSLRQSLPPKGLLNIPQVNLRLNRQVIPPLRRPSHQLFPVSPLISPVNNLLPSLLPSLHSSHHLCPLHYLVNLRRLQLNSLLASPRRLPALTPSDPPRNPRMSHRRIPHFHQHSLQDCPPDDRLCSLQDCPPDSRRDSHLDSPLHSLLRSHLCTQEVTPLGKCPYSYVMCLSQISILIEKLQKPSL